MIYFAAKTLAKPQVPNKSLNDTLSFEHKLVRGQGRSEVHSRAKLPERDGDPKRRPEAKVRSNPSGAVWLSLAEFWGVRRQASHTVEECVQIREFSHLIWQEVLQQPHRLDHIKRRIVRKRPLPRKSSFLGDSTN